MSASANPALADPLQGLTVLERGWLSSNNIVIHPGAGESGAVLVDTSHVTHAQQTAALVAHALRGAPLARIVNTHLHSDHCGGNASLKAAYGAPIAVPPGLGRAVAEWDPRVLTYESSGQLCERFTADEELVLDAPLRAGGRDWEVLAAPGHDPDSVMLFDRAHGVLISADALWENGFGVVFPELEGEPGFGDVGAVLDFIATLPVRVVIPGHGAPFTDVPGALARARQRLAGFQADPQRHARYAIKVLIKYHLMEVRRQPMDELVRWAANTPFLQAIQQRQYPEQADASGWVLGFVEELLASGALLRQGADVLDATAA